MNDTVYNRRELASDIVFLVDISSGRQDYLAILEERLLSFFDTLLGDTGSGDRPRNHWRAKVVGCADFTVDAEPFEDHPFTEDIEALRQQLISLRCRTGNPALYSSLPDALHRLATMPMLEAKSSAPDPRQWRYRRGTGHFVFAFTALPCRAALTNPVSGSLGDVVDAIHKRGLIFGLFAPDTECYDPLIEADRAEYFMVSYPAPVPRRPPEQELVELISDPAIVRNAVMLIHSSVSHRFHTGMFETLL